MKLKPTTYFLGSGKIAIPTLAALIESPDIKVVGCGTQPDRVRGRKRRLMATDVGAWCAERGQCVDKPASVNDEAFVNGIREMDVDYLLVFSFGQILRSKLLSAPKKASINVHASLLPRHRGAAPIAAAILAGDQETGVTFMKMNEKVDAGEIYKQLPISIPENIYATELSDRLASLAAAHVCDTIRDIDSGNLKPKPQESEGESYARRLRKTDGYIRWTDSAAIIERQIRALTPWPGVWFTLRQSGRADRRVTVTRATVEDGPSSPVAAGTVLEAGVHGLRVACASGVLRIKTVIPEGKREMDVVDFLLGNPIQSGSKLAS